MTAALTTTAQTPPDDPYLWLEDVQGEKALAWVRERNRESRAVLEKHPRFEAMRARILDILDSKENIPTRRAPRRLLYNLWQDAKNPRGLWRRTTLAEYRKPQPAWETVLDLDALGAAEKENWVWEGSTCLGPAYRRCLLSLSRGGADAVGAARVRHASQALRRAKDGGFVVAEAKSSIDWIDANTVYVGTDFGPGSMTDSGYPRVVKRWQRGTADRRGGDGVRGRGQGRGRHRQRGPHARLRAHGVRPRHRLLQQQAVAAAGRQADRARLPERCQLRVLARPRADPVAQRLEARRQHLAARLAAGRRCCRVPEGRAQLHRAVHAHRHALAGQASPPRTAACCCRCSTTWPAACRSGRPTARSGRSAKSRRPSPARSACSRCTIRCWARRTRWPSSTC